MSEIDDWSEMLADDEDARLRKFACGVCGGTGLHPGNETCDHCDGTGDEYV